VEVSRDENVEAVLGTRNLVSACGGNFDSNVAAPGAGETAKSQLLEAGADLPQSKMPRRSLTPVVSPSTNSTPVDSHSGALRFESLF
jgi:hypothetical protein